MRVLKALFVLVSICPLASAQEIAQFYQRGGGKILSAKFGTLEQIDLQIIPQLSYPKITVPVQEKLRLIKAEAELRFKKNSETNQLTQLALRPLSLGAYASLVLGDYYWNRTKEQASFFVASQHYLKALDLALDSPEYLEDITSRVLANVAKPKWATTSNSISYGAFGNFLPAEKLEIVAERINNPDLKMLLDLRIAQSKSRQGSMVNEICEAIKTVLDVNKKNESRAEALLLLSQYAGMGCQSQYKSDELLQQIIKDYGSTEYPAVVRARALLKVEKKTVFSLDIEPNEDSTELPLPKVIRLRGSPFKATPLVIKELGLLTDDGLKANKIEITPWLTSPAKIITSFFIVAKNIITENKYVGEYDNLGRLPSGPYLISAGGENHFALNSELLLLLARQKDQLFVQSISLKTGSAIPDVRLEVQVRTPNGLDSSRKTTVLTSDVTGLTTIANPKKACLAVQECDSEEVVIVGQKFRHMSVIGVNFEKIIWPFEGDPEFWIVPSAESVKPGDTVTWNLIARPDVFPRFSQSVIQYLLIHPNGAKVGQRNSEFDRFGRAPGVTPISKKFSPGKYEIEVKVLSKITGELMRFTQPIDVN